MPTFAELGFWKVGGPMEHYVEAGSVDALGEALRAARDHGRGLFVLGAGSNLLVPDEGLAGHTVQLVGAFKGITLAEGALRVGAGVRNAVLLNRYLGRLSGLGPLAGVPGTMGGAVAMNAGTALGEVADSLIAVEGFTASGEYRRLTRAELPMHYRVGGLPSGFVVCFAELRVQQEGAAHEGERVQQHLERRRATQPLTQPSCGSVFRNPQGDHAGRLIEACGLKGFRAGGAQISEKHANFIVNLGDATASDVLTCILHAQRAVHQERGVLLSPEVHIVGAWSKKVWRGGRISE